MATHSIQLGLEELDSRTLPNATMPVVAEPIMAMMATPADSHSLHGMGGGTYVVSSSNPDVGNQFNLTGATDLHGPGAFNVTGSIQTVGFIRQGHATGDLVLSNAQGTITLSLEGPTQPGFSPPPSKFTYTITGGTGAYQNESGSGNLHVTFIPAPVVASAPQQGVFVLKFS